MSDKNTSYQDALTKRKKRNQFISVLIIVAIVLVGVIVWGWLELEKSRNAERIKNALNSQVEPGFKESENIPMDPVTDTSTLVIQDTTPAPVMPDPEPLPIEEPTTPKVTAKRPEPKVKTPVVPKPPVPEPKKVLSETVAEEPLKPAPEPVATPVKPAPTPVKTAEPKPVPPIVEPVAVAPSPAKVPAAPPVAPPVVAPKAFPPEDLPVPTKAEPSEEARLAMAFVPAPAIPEKSASATASETPGASNNFKLGLAAYRQQDYVNATRLFSALSKPASKKRGTLDREEYVQANFLKGVSLLKVGHMSEAVTAFKNVLDYEKYYPLANMNLGICYVEMKQYAKAHQAFEAVIRDQSFIESTVFDDVMQRTKYFWALAWTRLYKNATNIDKQNYYRQQAVLKWKDYDVWFSKNEKYKTENQKAENYLKSLSSL